MAQCASADGSAVILFPSTKLMNGCRTTLIVCKSTLQFIRIFFFFSVGWQRTVVQMGLKAGKKQNFRYCFLARFLL